MHLESSHWDQWEARFTALAEASRLYTGPKSILGQASLHLCLYGENGVSPETEFLMLDELEAAEQAQPGTVQKIEIETSYWQEVVLFKA
ncbi:MAG: hypothetical protein VKJ06_00220 [Vampirovibrionales bacterium]|nr:hypothetical protein [Vampirovibrionales bacterium]